MTLYRASFICLGLALLFTACTSTLDTLERQPSARGAFNAALQQEYMGLAKWLKEDGHMQQAEFFAARGLKSATDEDLSLPPVPAGLDPEDSMEVYDARQRLLRFLGFANAQWPREKAVAFANFDCWMTLQDRSESAAVCRRSFYTAMALLGGLEQVENIVADNEAEERTPDENLIETGLPQVFVLFFERGSRALTGPSEADVFRIIELIEANEGKLSVQILGHTDRQGDARENLKASLDRALYIEERLRSAQNAPHRMDVQGYGESQPLVWTPDDVAEPLNRRVVVIVS